MDEKFVPTEVTDLVPHVETDVIKVPKSAAGFGLGILATLTGCGIVGFIKRRFRRKKEEAAIDAEFTELEPEEEEEEKPSNSETK